MTPFVRMAAVIVEQVQLQELFFQNRECIENFFWHFFLFKSRKEKIKKLKKIKSVLRKKFTQNVALRVEK